ncbi:hypothetical protein [Actinomadura terrae]|uniref:hypothetical protein n=1 Tax=Actinomadura terrae TaxID=604353 RepID=UPI001FA74B3C|nr:hypothetical protein [Actinomadura terrae]
MDRGRLRTAVRDRIRSISSARPRRRGPARLMARTMVGTGVRAQGAIALVLQFDAAARISVAGGAAAGIAAALAVLLAVHMVGQDGASGGTGASGASGGEGG